jgi:hypothetical protein
MYALGTCWQFLIGNPPDYFELYGANRALGPLVSSEIVFQHLNASFSPFSLFSYFSCLPICLSQLLEIRMVLYMKKLEKLKNCRLRQLVR